MDEENTFTAIEDVNVVEYEIENIKNMIYTIRGNQVMLDSDVARLYHCETRIINQAVKRNIERFPEKFCFRLTAEEVLNLKSHFVISSLTKENSYGGRRKLPMVFTEQGIAMLSGLLKNALAIQVSISIMDAFVEMRKFISSNGQIYDAYSLIIEIIKRAQNKIFIIDNYIDDSILQMLSKKNENVEVIILTSKKFNLTKLDIQKFNKQYPILKLVNTNKFHDRFIVIDNKELYHIGASLKDLGKKCFAISKIEDIEYIEKINQIS